MPIFLDTGFLVALESKRDANHKKARAYWGDFVGAPEPLVTTTYVFDEVVTYFNSRGFHDKAVEIGERLQTRRLLTLVEVDGPLFSEGWAQFKRYADKSYSLTDCISFVVMRKQGIKRALAFDQHFTQAGFERIPVP